MALTMTSESGICVNHFSSLPQFYTCEKGIMQTPLFDVLCISFSIPSFFPHIHGMPKSRWFFHNYVARHQPLFQFTLRKFLSIMDQSFHYFWSRNSDCFLVSTHSMNTRVLKYLFTLSYFQHKKATPLIFPGKSYT